MESGMSNPESELKPPVDLGRSRFLAHHSSFHIPIPIPFHIPTSTFLS